MFEFDRKYSARFFQPQNITGRVTPSSVNRLYNTVIIQLTTECKYKGVGRAKALNKVYHSKHLQAVRRQYHMKQLVVHHYNTYVCPVGVRYSHSNGSSTEGIWVIPNKLCLLGGQCARLRNKLLSILLVVFFC